MLIDPEGFHAFADLVISVGERSRAEQDGEIPIQTQLVKPDGSLVCMTDMLNERLLVGGIRKLWPKMGIFAEEQHYEMPEEQICAVMDPLDGTKEFLSRVSRRNSLYGKRWGVSAGMLLFVDGGMPFAGIVCLPKLHLAFKVLKKDAFGNHAGIWQFNYDEREWAPWMFGRPPNGGKKLRLGTDYGPTSPSHYRYEVNLVRRALRDKLERKRTNMPAVYAGIEVFLGNISCWWSHTLKPWDAAVISLLLTESRKIAENLAGGPIRWATNGRGNTRVAPIMFADSEESAYMVREVIFSGKSDKRRLYL